MRAKRSSEVIIIEGVDETGQIPEGVSSVLITYSKDGTNIFYNAVNIRGPESIYDDATDLVNNQRPQTQEGIEKIVRLLMDSME